MTYALLALDLLTKRYEILLGTFPTLKETAAFIASEYNVSVHATTLSKLLKRDEETTAWLISLFYITRLENIHHHFDSSRGRAIL